VIGCVLFNNFLTGNWVKLNHPIEQGRTNIEADLFKITQFSVWAIALRVDPFVPIGIWSGAWLDGNDTGQWIFTGRLVKMCMDSKSVQSD
jgi:hypothetical protein